MSKALPIAFVAILCFVGAGVDYAYFYTQQQLLTSMNKTAYKGYGDFVSQRFASLSAPSETMALPTFLPSAPDGWERRAYENADGTLATGRELLPTMLAIDDTNSLLQILQLPRVSSKHIVETYISGNSVIIVTLRFKSDRKPFGLKNRMAAEISETLANISAFGENDTPPPFALIKGVVVRQQRQVSKDEQTQIETKVDYREFYASVGTQFRVDVVTNATDAQVMTVLAGIDVLAMNKLLKNPVASINEYKPILTRDELQDGEIKDAEAEEAKAQLEAAALAESETEDTAPLVSDAVTAETSTSEKEDSKFGGKGCVRRAGVLTCS